MSRFLDIKKIIYLNQPFILRKNSYTKNDLYDKN